MVKAALKNPCAVIVLALAILVIGLTAITHIATDILPQFKTPAVQVLTLYPDMPADVMEKDLTSRIERWTGQSNGVARQESKSMVGVSVVRDYCDENTDPNAAMAQVTSLAMSDLYYLPPGTIPPMIMPLDPTASIPLCLIAVSSPTLDETALYDVAYYELRNRLQGISGVVAPAVFGGKLRRILAYVDREKAQSRGLSPLDVMLAIQKANTMIPTGDAKLGAIDYQINANGMVGKVADMNQIPITMGNGRPTYVGDVADVQDSHQIQQNIVHINGKRQVYIPIYRQPGANTIAVVDGIKSFIKPILERIPGINLDVVMDQSVYVRQAIRSLSQEAVIGFLLAAAMVFIFLRSYRPTLIVILALSLAVLGSLIGLYFTHQTLNVMTLGGLALVIGLLIDESIVVLENTSRHLAMGKTAFDLDVNRQSYAPGGALVSQLDLGDAIYKKLAAKQVQYAAGHALEARRQDSILAAAQGYFDLAFAHGAAGVARQAVRISTDYETQLKSAVAAGVAFKGDMLRVSVEAERNRIALRAATEKQRVAAARLAQTLHLDPSVELSARDATPVPISLMERKATLDSLVRRAISLRPELKQDRALIEAASEGRKGAVYGPLVPTVSASAYGGGLGGGTGGSTGNFGGQQDYSVGLGWRIGPGGLFDHGRQHAAEARLNSAQLNAEKTHDGVIRQVVEAFTRVQSESEQISMARRGLSAAEEALQLSKERQEWLRMQKTVHFAMFSAFSPELAVLDHFLRARFSEGPPRRPDLRESAASKVGLSLAPAHPQTARTSGNAGRRSGCRTRRQRSASRSSRRTSRRWCGRCTRGAPRPFPARRRHTQRAALRRSPRRAPPAAWPCRGGASSATRPASREMARGKPMRRRQSFRRRTRRSAAWLARRRHRI
ncbi:MAG: efflux RND transporter permease subunit, partial [Chthoniobacteraceae bacterium]